MSTPFEMPQEDISELSLDTYSQFFEDIELLKQIQVFIKDIASNKYERGIYECTAFARDLYVKLKSLGINFLDVWKISFIPYLDDLRVDKHTHAMVYIKNLKNGNILLIEPQSPSGKAFFIKGPIEDIEKEDELMLKAYKRHLRSNGITPSAEYNYTIIMGDVMSSSP